MRNYIGTRDFPPDTMEFRQWMFGVQRKICEAFGYVEYGGPIVEAIELYRNKTSEEIVSEQLYSFQDKKGREIAIRPEMTPTLARMVAHQERELVQPIRWYSIANFMRYERPGHNRLREFYQLNVDLLGEKGMWADVEMLRLVVALLHSYGASQEHYTIYFSDRQLILSLLRATGDALEPRRQTALTRLLDKKQKITDGEFQSTLRELLPEQKQMAMIQKILQEPNPFDFILEYGDHPQCKEMVGRLQALLKILTTLGMTEICQLQPCLARGFDYYTGLIFEVYDRHPQNHRSIFGGGRYDTLLGKYRNREGKKEFPAIGFGMGDVAFESFLNVHNLNPFQKESRGNSSSELRDKQCMLIAEDPIYLMQNYWLADDLRKQGWIVEENTQRKIAKQLKIAVHKKHRFVIILDHHETIQTAECIVKDLRTGFQEKCSPSQAIVKLQQLQRCLDSTHQ